MTLQYEQRYCLFLDILGFKSLVHHSVDGGGDKTSGGHFLRLKSALDQIREDVHRRETVWVSGAARPSSRRVTQFSDSVIVSYSTEEPYGGGIDSIIMDAHNLHMMLINKGILIRGAITKGLLFHDENLIFGPALNEAVELESEAKYPRVIMERALLEDAGFALSHASEPEITRSISSMVSEDFDGLFYVDYFNLHPDDFGDPNEAGDGAEWYLKKLETCVKELAKETTPCLRVKHSWLRKKLNELIEPFCESNYSKLGSWKVPEEDRCLFLGIKPV